jgi:hypothetical protein
MEWPLLFRSGENAGAIRPGCDRSVPSPLQMLGHCINKVIKGVCCWVFASFRGRQIKMKDPADRFRSGLAGMGPVKILII